MCDGFSTMNFTRLSIENSFRACLLPLLLATPGLGTLDSRGANAAPATQTETHRRMQMLVDDHTIAGAVTLVARHGKIEALETIGFSDLAHDIPMKENNLFWIASMTKPMTAVAVLILQDEGKLSVEDPVEKHLPEFKGQWLAQERDSNRVSLVRSPRPITIRDLLTHTAGLSEVSSPRFNVTLAEMVMGYSQQPLRFAPGTKWEYSNPAINTLGRIVEIVSKQKFETFLQQRILDPLKMKETTFWPNSRQIRRLAKSYKAGKSNHLEETSIYFIQGELSDRRRTPYPAGGLFSTARDVWHFYQMMLNGGTFEGKRVLSAESVRLMTRTQTGEIKTGFVNGMSWGYGFQVVKEPIGVTGMLAPGSFGHGGAYGTQSWADPAKDLVLILMIQRSGFPNGDDSPARRAFQESAVSAHNP